MTAGACRTAADPMTRLCSSLAPCSPPSSTPRAAPRWPSAMLDCGCARRLGVIRPGRRNGPYQPNKETSYGCAKSKRKGSLLDADRGPFCVPIDTRYCYCCRRPLAIRCSTSIAMGPPVSLSTLRISSRIACRVVSGMRPATGRWKHRRARRGHTRRRRTAAQMCASR